MVLPGSGLSTFTRRRMSRMLPCRHRRRSRLERLDGVGEGDLPVRTLDVEILDYQKGKRGNVGNHGRGLSQKTMRSYEKALKSGIQMQEESVNLWKKLLTKLGSPEELQAKLESMTADVFPKARKRMEEFVETFNRTSNQTMDLFEKTLGVYQATSVTDAQRRMQDLIENSLSTLRVKR